MSVPRKSTLPRDEYKDKYFEEKFKTVNDKLDNIHESVGTKASAGSVARLEVRVVRLEETHMVCPVVSVVTDVGELKKNVDSLMDVTEDIRFYKKRPAQFKMLVAGFILLMAIQIAAAIPQVIKYFKQQDKTVKTTALTK